MNICMNCEHKSVCKWCIDDSDFSTCSDFIELRPKGKWIVDEEHSITMTFYKCTNCNWFGGVTWYKFCPICGADMQVGK